MATHSLFLQEYARMRREYGIRLYSKDQKWTGLWKLIHYFLFIISFGKLSNFMNHYVITVGKYVFFPPGWKVENATKEDYVTLCHEGHGHVNQNTLLGAGNAWVGCLVMGFLYLFVPLPIGFAWFRFSFERAAYRESYYACKRVGLVPPVDHYIKVLTGPSYLWAWCIKETVESWFAENCK